MNDFRIRADLIAWLKSQSPRGGRLIEDALLHCYSFNPEPPAVAHIAYDIEEDRRRLQRVLDSVPAEYPLLRDQIKIQMEYSRAGYHLAWHILTVYGVSLYNMDRADMKLVEGRLNYWTMTAGSPNPEELQKQEEKEIMKNRLSKITGIPVEDFQNQDDMEVILEKLAELVGNGDQEAIAAVSKMISSL